MSKDGEIRRKENAISFIGGFRPEDMFELCRCLHPYLIGKPPQIILDFARCTAAFPNTMLPLIAYCSRLRHMGYRIDAFLPNNPKEKQRFLTTNWAHYLSPDQYKLSDDYTEPHLAVKHYQSSQEQYSILRQTLDVVLRTVEAPRSAMSSLEWSLSEIMDNVLNHSNSVTGGFVQIAIFPFEKKLAFCVADSGRGILASLQEAIPTLGSDRVAIQEAVRGGVTRNSDFGQGNGLSGSLALATQTGGWFRIVSGQAEVAWIRNEPIITECESQGEFYGTVVDVQIPYANEIDINAILAESTKLPDYSSVRHPNVDFLEVQYLTEDGNAITLRMRDETTGFGSRYTGSQMRLKTINLLNGEPNLPLLIDWDGIQVIASSYADEFVGKLFVELGPMGFMTRIRMRNLAPVVKALIDRAILQRTQQMSPRGR